MYKILSLQIATNFVIVKEVCNLIKDNDAKSAIVCDPEHKLRRSMLKRVKLRLLGVTGTALLVAGLVACGGGGSSAATATPATSGACATASNCTLPSAVSAVPPQQ